LRLASHDAIGFSNTTHSGGGADGSIITLNEVKLKYAANSDLKITVALLKSFIERHNISPGNL